MITSDADRRSYLRTALSYVDALPLLIAEGTPDQVHHELDRLRRTIESVEHSLELPRAIVYSSFEQCRAPCEACDED